MKRVLIAILFISYPVFGADYPKIMFMDMASKNYDCQTIAAIEIDRLHAESAKFPPYPIDQDCLKC